MAQQQAGWARTAACLTVAVFAVGGCAWMQPAPPVERVFPAQVLLDYDLRREMLPDQARQAQREVRAARTQVADAMRREEIACYGRFLTNRCLRELAQRRRTVEVRLDAIEVAANQVLREQAAYETSLRLAQDEAQRLQQSQDLERREATNRREFEVRQQAAARAQAEREAQAPELARRAQRQEEAMLRRQREIEARLEQAERRAAQEKAAVAARERALQAQRQKELERQRRDAERDARPGSAPGGASGGTSGRPSGSPSGTPSARP